MIELSDVEIQQLKEQNQKRIKRVVTLVAILLTGISIILVGLSLSLGPKIDQLVSESLDGKISSRDLFLGPKKNDTDYEQR
uniref:Col_cuticle_N domain-containing protein n=1 Tax=Panagrellus redivivus TaxID=6233 RepID=A0A7E4VVK4_PANRE